MIATGCEDGSVHIWDVATAKVIGPPRFLRRQVIGVAFRPNGRSLLAADAGGNLREWQIPDPPGGSVEELVGRLQVRSGLEHDATREIAVLGADAWRRRRAEFGTSAGATVSSDELEWHERCARNAEASGNGFAVRWHLKPMIAVRPADGLLYARKARSLLWDGQIEAAEADIARAIELGPRDRILDWLVHSAEDARSDGRPADALRVLNRVVAAQPHDWVGLARRSEVMAMLGRMSESHDDQDRAVENGAGIPFVMRLAEERLRAGECRSAANLYDRAISRGIIPYEEWYEAALAHLECDDTAGYHRLCAEMCRRNSGTEPEPLVRLALAKVCTLESAGPSEVKVALRWIEPMAAPLPNQREYRHIVLNLLGSLLYRSGRPREAIERINQGIVEGGGTPIVSDVLFLALAYESIANHPQARAVCCAVPGGSGRTADLVLGSAQLRFLQRRAESIMVNRFPPNPFVR